MNSVGGWSRLQHGAKMSLKRCRPMEQYHQNRVRCLRCRTLVLRQPLGLSFFQVRNSGASLSFISPEMRDGCSVAKLTKSEVDKLSEVWARALIMYVVGDTPSIGAIMRYIAAEWSHVAKPRVFLHDAGYFLVHFASTDDRNEVLYGGPHSFNSQPIIVKQWTTDLDFNKEVLRVIPIWVRFPSLPLNCWTPDSLSRIGSVLGVPLFADECTTKQMRVSFALPGYLLNWMSVTQELPKVVQIEDPNGLVFDQKVTYDWLPPFCEKCQLVGHVCPEKQAQTKKKPSKRCGFLSKRWLSLRWSLMLKRSNVNKALMLWPLLKR